MTQYYNLRNAGQVYGRVKCSLPNQDPKQTVKELTYTTSSCGVRDETQEIKEGEHPKQCATDADCEMQNGQTTSCKCGMDSKYWCQAAWGSEEFDGFWDDCDNGVIDGL